MIHDSYAWKRDLYLKKRKLIKYNSKLAFDKNFDLAYHKVESVILYSAFIIRKLIESEKLSATADAYSVVVKKYLPVKHIDRLHHWCDEDRYDWDKSISKTITGKNICNQLIHSYVLQLLFEEDGAAIGFFVSSDYDRNKGLIEISLEDWLRYMNIIISDSVVTTEAHFDKNKDDYIFVRKERGKW